jgi:TonB family protein
MRISLYSVLFAVLLAQASRGDSKQDAADGLFRRAAETSGPTAVIKGPYRIQYRLTFHGVANRLIEGTYTSAWVSRNEWRREVSMPGFRGIEVSEGPSRWIERKPHLFEPQIVTKLRVNLELAADVRLAPNEKIYKISEDTHGSTRLRCIWIHTPNLLVGDKSLCFDESSGALIRITEGARRTEFSDFDRKDGALIARKVMQFVGKELDSEADLTSLDPQSIAAADLLHHSPDSRQFNNCDSDITTIDQGKALVHINPVYPPVARMAHQTGTVEIYLVIDTDGTVKDMEIIRGASKLLDDAAVEAVRKWRYEPYKCGGRPIQVESTTYVTFSL